MELKKSKRFLIILACIYWIFAISIYLIAKDQFQFRTVSEEVSSPEYVIGEIVDGMKLQQSIIAPADELASIELFTATYARENHGSLRVVIEDPEGMVLVDQFVDISSLKDNAYSTIVFEEKIYVDAGALLSVTFMTQGCQTGNAITLYAGRTLLSVESIESLHLNGEATDGYLCIQLSGIEQLSHYIVYWCVLIVAFLLLMVYTMLCWREAKKGKSNPIVSLCTVYSRYSFLIKQLVARDFKTKYKRSALGMAWSFMNPLLTMGIQYIVFSTLFKSDIPNYPVYLLTGIVFFSFFNEALTMGMTSITSNAALIKKVYMPKYIYPVSRILSSLVNFAFALMPLFLVMLITGTPFRISMLLLVFDIACLLAFIIGMTLLLTTAMTFFQDTQFLWSVAAMMWQYLTPIFYPETIIPAPMLPLYRINPMYQFISFARVCITDGVSPEPASYVYCIAWAVGVLLLGAVVFKKQQNKFVLYL